MRALIAIIIASVTFGLPGFCITVLLVWWIDDELTQLRKENKEKGRPLRTLRKF